MNIPAIPSTVPLDAADGFPACNHVVDPDSALALRAALATGRPLLVRGEPGIGKSQLARAAAAVLSRPLVTRTLDARTEISDLFWDYDALRRLAEAQLAAARVAAGATIGSVTEGLDMVRFTRPDALWWALDWGGAAKLPAAEHSRPGGHAGDDAPPNGVVLLLDEIDKVDSSVPNALLDAITHGDFVGPDGVRHAMTSPRPMIIITSNEERPLPDAFVRRCLVLSLGLPRDAADAKTWLAERVGAHSGLPAGGDVFEKAVDLLLRERKTADGRGARRPSLAELLDLLRAVTELYAPNERVDALESLARLALSKPSPDELR